MKNKAISENLKSFFLDYVSTITAGAGNDNTEVATDVIDIQGFESGLLNYVYHTTLADTKTLSIAIKIYQSADNSTFDSGTAILSNTVLATGTTGGSTIQGIYQLALDNLNQYKRYVKFGITADLSATGTDTVIAMSNAVLGGFSENPVT